jgi:hypothetical protein
MKNGFPGKEGNLTSSTVGLPLSQTTEIEQVAAALRRESIGYCLSVAPDRAYKMFSRRATDRSLLVR